MGDWLSQVCDRSIKRDFEISFHNAALWPLPSSAAAGAKGPASTVQASAAAPARASQRERAAG
jgi:hypothetical protein